MIGCKTVPTSRLEIILLFEIMETKEVLRIAVALISCKAIPTNTFGWARCKESQIELGFGIALIGRPTPPPNSFR